jgi:hypothetical protein
MNITRKHLILASVALGALYLVCILLTTGITFSDELMYIQLGNDLFDKIKEQLVAPSNFANRVGHNLNIAVGLKIFGISILGADIVNLVLFTFLIFVISDKLRRRLDGRAAFFFLALSFLNIVTLYGFKDVQPDLTAAIFFLSAYFLFGEINFQSFSAREFLKTVAVILLLSWSFISKELSILWFPVLFLNTRPFSFRQKLLIPVTVMIASVCFLLGYFYLTAHDPLYRLKIAEAEFNTEVWSYTKSSLAEKTYLRWIKICFMLLQEHFTAFIALVLLAYALIAKAISIKKLSACSYSLGFLLLFAISFFGTTSLKSYSPVPVSERMWIIIQFFSALSISEIIYEITSNTKVKRGVFILSVVSWILSYFLFRSGIFLVYNFCVLLVLFSYLFQRWFWFVPLSAILFFAFTIRSNLKTPDDFKDVVTVYKAYNDTRPLHTHKRLMLINYLNTISGSKNMKVVGICDNKEETNNFLVNYSLLEFECNNYSDTCACALIEHLKDKAIDHNKFILLKNFKQ